MGRNSAAICERGKVEPHDGGFRVYVSVKRQKTSERHPRAFGGFCRALGGLMNPQGPLSDKQVFGECIGFLPKISWDFLRNPTRS